jgi:hypothetical protein
MKENGGCQYQKNVHNIKNSLLIYGMFTYSYESPIIIQIYSKD